MPRCARSSLLEPAEAYYAHKLHAALEGLNQTPEIKEIFDTKTLAHGAAGQDCRAHGGRGDVRLDLLVAEHRFPGEVDAPLRCCLKQ